VRSLASSKKNKFQYGYKLADVRWAKRKLAILATRGNQCEDCGATKNIQLHHLRYETNRQPWEYPDAELRLLCIICHRETHGYEEA